MNVIPTTTAGSNPFSTRFVRPGAIDYLFPPGESTHELVRRLERANWRGQIIGEHGSGKSTLLASLLPAIAQAGRAALLVVLHDRQRRLPAGWVDRARLAARSLIVVDGYEQLGLASRLRLKRVCRRREWGLLVTAHRDVGLPALFRTEPSLEMAQAVVGHLLSGRADPFGAEAVADHFAECRGNLREMLFALYDRHEAVVRRPPR
jgi:hypothetical protein